MKRTLLTLLLLSAFLSIVLVAKLATAQDSAVDQQPAVGATFHVGVGRTNITPTEPMWMAGYASRTTPWEEVLMDIWAKAMLVRDSDGNSLLLITLDLVGIDQGLGEQICKRIQQKHGLQRSQIAIATSHTHSGPVVGMNLRAMHFYQLSADEQQKISNYSLALIGHIESAVDAAFGSLKPVQLRSGRGEASFATNRRNNPEAEVPNLRAERKLSGPVDHSVPVLAAYDSSDKPIAIVFGYGCHSTVLSHNKISGDYPGYAQAALEQAYPGAIAMFWAGCGADINPLPRRTEELAEFYGHQLAMAVKSVLLTHKLETLKGPLSHQMSYVPLKLATLPTRKDLETQLLSSNKYEVMRAKLLLEQIDAGRPLKPTYEFPVQTWQFSVGPEWIFLGGEVVVDFSLRVASERPKNSTWVTSYANDVMAYIPSERVLREGGYEGQSSMIYYGLPTVWETGVEQAIMDEVHLQLNK